MSFENPNDSDLEISPTEIFDQVLNLVQSRVDEAIGAQGRLAQTGFAEIPRVFGFVDEDPEFHTPMMTINMVDDYRKLFTREANILWLHIPVMAGHPEKPVPVIFQPDSRFFIASTFENGKEITHRVDADIYYQWLMRPETQPIPDLFDKLRVYLLVPMQIGRPNER
jgi:hypothetical protein